MHVFTLPQILLIFILAGLITVVVLSRLTPNDQSLSGAADILRMHIRHAQVFSQSYRRVYGLQSSRSIGYFLFEDTPENISKLPGAEDVYHLQGSMTISNFTLYFNRQGTPCADLAGNSPMRQEISITIQDGMESKTVTIMPDSGYVF